MAQKSPGQSDPNLEGNIFVIALAITIMALIFWVFFGRHYSAFMGVVRKYELSLFMPFFDGAADLYGKLKILNGGSLEFVETVHMLTKTGNYVRFLFIPPILVMTYYLYVKSFRGRYAKRHSMSSLAKQEAALWPEIAPVAGRQVEMVEGDITKGEYAVALTEWEFAEKNKLAQRGGKLDRDRSRDVFSAQLGTIWAGPDALPKHTRALYAALLLRIAGKGTDSTTAFRKMASTFKTGGINGMDTSFADAAIAEHGSHRLAKMVIERHAYVFTVMATMLQISRADGVLASPMFIWLKTVDRKLWYTLNNVGRYSFHVECAGIMGHWLFEKTVGAACPSPMVEKAIDGLDLALKDFSESDEEHRLFL
ncbi:type IVB secretion system coupling complex protein DotM/IcmP [Paucibacter soli]|uniref:type IVB secretion system coupling complex protein DotM/IcmP n=1 Tax=Paucibacter soli TaxID=3133433 RepID=UPI003098CBE4